MATEAEFTLDADDFPLGSVFETYPDAVVELERIVPSGDVGIVPYFWVRDVDGEEDVAERLVGHPAIQAVQLVDTVDDHHLLRARWAPEYHGVVTAIVETDVVLLSAIGTGDGWTFRIRSDTRGAIAEFQQNCRDHGVPITLTSVRALASLEADDDLTEKQREALVLAYHRGYFDSPRETTLAEVADELGISQQALASRIRRGSRRLIANVLLDSESAT